MLNGSPSFGRLDRVLLVVGSGTGITIVVLSLLSLILIGLVPTFIVITIFIVFLIVFVVILTYFQLDQFTTIHNDVSGRLLYYGTQIFICTAATGSARVVVVLHCHFLGAWINGIESAYLLWRGILQMTNSAPEVTHDHISVDKADNIPNQC
jgi:hypothetical protein